MDIQVILVDANDQSIGEAEKMYAHQHALLHRAVSLFIFNDKMEMLIQRRALGKYHSPGLWTNAACTHPYPGETTHDAAIRRAREEMNLVIKTVTPLFQFLYKEELEHGLWEHEYDHVFYGITNVVPQPNEEEVADFKYVSMADLQEWVTREPEAFTVWFKKIVERVVVEMKSI